MLKEKLSKELKRSWPFLLLAGLLLAPDPGALSVVGYAVGIVSLVVILSHLAVKVLFPDLNLEKLIKEIGSENNIAAAIVVAAVVALMGIILTGTITLLK